MLEARTMGLLMILGLIGVGCSAAPDASEPSPGQYGTEDEALSAKRKKSKTACTLAGFQCLPTSSLSTGAVAGACPSGMTNASLSCSLPHGPIGEFVQCCAPSAPPPPVKSACETANFQCVPVSAPSAATGGVAGSCPSGMTDEALSCSLPNGPIGDFVRCCAPTAVPSHS